MLNLQDNKIGYCVAVEFVVVDSPIYWSFFHPLHYFGVIIIYYS